MNIKPSAAIRQNYNEIAELCRSTGEPVYLTKNGVGTSKEADGRNTESGQNAGTVPFLDGTGPFRKLFAPNWYLVFYLVEGDTVFVEYIIDGRQDYRWLLS